jgi:hypothetical protein
MTDDRPRLIIYPKTADQLEGLARIARHVLAPDYQWPSDGIAFVRTEAADGTVLCAAGIRKNKRSITLWEQ